MKKKLLLITFALISFLGKTQTPADALNFDGNNDYVLLPSTLPSVGTSDCTFEAWVYPKLSISALQMILAKDQYGDPNSQLRLALVGGCFRFSMSAATSATIINITSPVYPINNWYHVAAVRQGTVYTLYVNGAVVSTTTTPSVINSNNPSHAWTVGCRKPYMRDSLNGSVDELRIWNVARTQCEINTYMNCEIPSTATGLIANYHFNQGVAGATNSGITNLTDFSGNSNTGTLTNFGLTGASSNWITPGGVTAGSITPLPPITVSALVSNSIICSGLSTTLSATGANTFTWSGGAINGAAFSPSVTSNYTVIGTNTLTACTNTAVTSVSVLPSPTVTVNSGSTCSNYDFTLTPAGAITYTYSSGTAVVTPTYNSSYTVTGTAANGCVGKAVSNLTVLPSPSITAFASQTVICAGQSVGLNAIGAVSYSWNGNASTSNITLTPVTTTAYIVTGAAANLCETSKTINIVVNPLPSLTITPERPTFCMGEKIKLTGSGATSYTWVSPGNTSPSVQVQPTITTTYTLNGESTQNCVGSKTFQLIVSACTGISQYATESLGLIIYPNPSQASISIKTDSDVTLSLINETAQVIKRFSLTEENDHSMSFSDLPSGIYFVFGSSGNSLIKEKIIITK